MAIQKTITLYTYEELNDEAKVEARDWWLVAGFGGDIPWEQIREDAGMVGLKIVTLSEHKNNKGEFITSAPQCAESILNHHGKECETYKTAQAYLAELAALGEPSDDAEGESREAWGDKREELDRDFLQAILEDYRIMLRKEEEYQTSEKYVAEEIIANDYTFREDGTREDLA